ncbi:MAG TPA: histidine triad nucleotide-binding protein [Firmicutes bacterium]|nr:histidine triad nucleotide-binding protein [Bacillota bacterium]
MSDCIFCRIINQEIPSKIVYEDDEILAFEDVNPLAPIHILLIPKKHIATMDDVTEEDSAVLGRILLKAKEIAAEKGLNENGYRIVNNCKAHGGQEVFHIHFHLLGGEKLGLFV